MDKEEEIQEMAKVLCGDKSKHLSSCKYCGETSCYFIANAELLYNAGYRKQSDDDCKEYYKKYFDAFNKVCEEMALQYLAFRTDGYSRKRFSKKIAKFTKRMNRGDVWHGYALSYWLYTLAQETRQHAKEK